MLSENSALNDRFAQSLKMELLWAKDGAARVKLDVQPQFLNGAGIVHGGVIFSLADYAFALASNAGPDSGLAVSVSINYIKAGLPGDVLFAEATLVSRSRKLGTYEISVTNQEGALLARVQALAYLKAKGK